MKDELIEFFKALPALLTFFGVIAALVYCMILLAGQARLDFNRWEYCDFKRDYTYCPDIKPR